MDTPPTRPTGFLPTLRFMLQTRKGIHSLVGFFTATVMLAGLVAGFVAGRMSFSEFYNRVELIGGGIVLLIWSYQSAIAKEDSGEKSRPTTIQAAEGARVEVHNSERPPALQVTQSSVVIPADVNPSTVRERAE